MDSFRRIARALALVLIVGLPACSGGGPATGSTALPTSAPFAVNVQPLSPSLQQALADVAAVRGLPVPAGTRAALVSRDQVPALLDSLLTDHDRRWYASTTVLYRLLGFLTADEDYYTAFRTFGADAILGLYAPRDRTLYVVQDAGHALDWDQLRKDQRRTLAHEFVHALQDSAFDLARTSDALMDDLDRNLAFMVVVEGDAIDTAETYADRYLRGPGGALLAVHATGAASVPAALQREFTFPYTVGADWLQAVRQAGGNVAVDALLRQPPPGTAVILRPGLRTAGWAPDAASLPDLAPALGKGWSRDSGGTLGQFILQNYLQLRLRGIDAAGAASGWAGDRYDVYVNDGESVAAFRLRFTDAEAARRFATAQQQLLDAANATDNQRGTARYRAVPGGATFGLLAPTGADVVFVAASNRALAERALAVLEHG